jgi:phosphoglycerate dehydrogenase-like enzyme
VIELLRPYDLEVALFDPFVDAEGAAALGATALGLDELCATSDVVSIHAPDLPETRGMIGARQLAAMRDGATLVNTARGRLVDHAALEAELVAGRLMAVLDVMHPEPLPPDSPLWQLPNVFLTPHLAGAQGRELARLTDLAIDQIERFVRGEPLTEEVREEDLSRMA